MDPKDRPTKDWRSLLSPCRLCPRECGVDRMGGEIGECGIGGKARVASWGPHFGEEAVLVGAGGSGTIFLGGCNLHCVFCQNWDISQQAAGRESSAEEIADLALELQDRGCENVNFVSPTHVAHAVAESLGLAREMGLRIPSVWNSGGYDSVEVLRRLEGRIDIYMPDYKWANAEAGRRYSDVDDYPRIASLAIQEMYRQVGPLQTDGRGVARRGLLVRHLVMPKDLAGSAELIEKLAKLAPGASINVMGQYRPEYRAGAVPELQSRVQASSIVELRDSAEGLGLQVLRR